LVAELDPGVGERLAVKIRGEVWFGTAGMAQRGLVWPCESRRGRHGNHQLERSAYVRLERHHRLSRRS
jgi:hypothetical protein